VILPIQLRECVIRPSLQPIHLWDANVEELLVGTCAKESLGGHYVMQEGKDGPVKIGLGIYQEEAATHDDIWKNFIEYRQTLRENIMSLCNFHLPPSAQELVTNLKYATIMARIKYLRTADPVPNAHDLDALANYWKQHYNSADGKGHPQEFVEAYRKYLG
jgi:hypothetical protein